jgi:hypothetical protein
MLFPLNGAHSLQLGLHPQHERPKIVTYRILRATRRFVADVFVADARMIRTVMIRRASNCIATPSRGSIQ